MQENKSYILFNLRRGAGGGGGGGKQGGEVGE